MWISAGASARPSSSLLVVPDSALLLQDPTDLSIKHSLCGAPRPALHHPCLAWRQAVLSQFSALETSGISLSVSQNSPKAPLISYSCCMAASRRLHPEHPLGGGRNVGGTAPEIGDSSSLGKSLHLQRKRLFFLNTKTHNSNPKGTGTGGQLSLCTDTADVKFQHQPSSLPRAGETQHYPPQSAYTFSRIKQSTNFSSSIHSPAQHGDLQLRGEKSPESRSGMGQYSQNIPKPEVFQKPPPALVCMQGQTLNPQRTEDLSTIQREKPSGASKLFAENNLLIQFTSYFSSQADHSLHEIAHC